MSPALRLLRLDSILALLGRALVPGSERLEDALDTLLDACPAELAVAFTPDRRGEPLAERRIPKSEAEASLLRARLWTAAERAILSGSPHRQELAPPSEDATPADLGRTALALPIHVGNRVEAVIALVFADRAMLDEETSRYLATTARLTELALERDAAVGRERHLGAELGTAADGLGSVYEELDRAVLRAKTLCDPEDRALVSALDELTGCANELARSVRGLEELAQPNRITRQASGASRRCKVFLIDDDPVFSRTVRRSLAPHDIRAVETASEAEMALLDPRYEPDLVVCDVSLPGINGNVLHARIAEQRPELASRFVFVTGGSLGEKETHYLSVSGCSTFHKPFDMQDLERLLPR